ncbi:hypothetical protein RJ641_001670 [Dillenia turbinata]|uniref:Uncharacterized protein n=1 Tax=Dillenia turbinata TaxID=194707 RepID=A0AAN8VLE1_9MAGN
MRNTGKNYPVRGFSTPPATWKSDPDSHSYLYHQTPPMPCERKRSSPLPFNADSPDPFHIIHKVPAGDSPYVKAKQVQLIEKDLSKSISLFWAAINSGDRVDSALKDMAVVMKQLNRADEAIEAVKSFRHLCPYESQESLDNVLVELYKRSGRIHEQIEMLHLKLNHIEDGTAFGGRRSKTARSQGKKIYVTLEQEKARRALSLELDRNKQCNLALCLLHMDRIAEAKSLLHVVQASSADGKIHEPYAKSFERAVEMLTKMESESALKPVEQKRGTITLPQGSFLSPSSRSKESTLSAHEGQYYASGLAAPRRLEDDSRTLLLGERSKESITRKLDRYKAGVSGLDKENSKFSSSHLYYVDKKSRGPHYEVPSQRSSNYSDEGSSCRRLYFSPVPFRGNLRASATEPRKVLKHCGYGDQRRQIRGDNVIEKSRKRLSFKCTASAENLHRLATQNHQTDSIGGDLGKSKEGDFTPMINGMAIRSKSPTIMSEEKSKNVWDHDLRWRRGDWKQQSWVKPVGEYKGNWNHTSYSPISENRNQRDKVVTNSSYSPSIANGNQNSWESNQQNSLSGNLVVESSIIVDDSKTFEALMSNSTVCAEENKSEQVDDQTKKQQQLPQDFSSYKVKKSWADMAEEEEEELLSESLDAGEGYDDENQNSNIVHQALSPLNQVDNLSESFKLCDLRSGHTMSTNAVPSKNPTAQRSLCFGTLCTPDSDNHGWSSPLTKKGLNNEKSNQMCAVSQNGLKLMRRNRLQVFQDITLLPESPRA